MAWKSPALYVLFRLHHTDARCIHVCWTMHRVAPQHSKILPLLVKKVHFYTISYTLNLFFLRSQCSYKTERKCDMQYRIVVNAYTLAWGFFLEKSHARPRSDIRTWPFSSSRIFAGWKSHNGTSLKRPADFRDNLKNSTQLNRRNKIIQIITWGVTIAQ